MTVREVMPKTGVRNAAPPTSNREIEVRTRVSVPALFASTALSIATMAPAHAALDDAAAQELLKKSTCTRCHKLEKTAVGPSFRDVAKKRNGQASAVDDLKKVVRNGSTGTYGTASMPGFAADKISDADLTDVIEWILTKWRTV